MDTTAKKSYYRYPLLATIVLMLAVFACPAAFWFYGTGDVTLSLSPPCSSVYPGDRFTLDYATDSRRIPMWYSSDEDILTVDDEGILTAHAPGTALVTIACGAERAETLVQVREDPLQSGSGLFRRDDLVLTLGNTRSLADLGADFTWYSCDPQVFTVSDGGIVTAISAGAARIVATNGEITHLYGITATEDAIPGCFFLTSHNDFSLYPGFSSVCPVRWNGDAALFWYSSDENIAAVQDGIVEARHSGSCEITVTDGITAYSLPLTVGYSAAGMIDDERLHGDHIFLYDATEGKLLFSKGDLDERVYPASLTKLFTGYVAMQIIPENAAIIPGAELDTCPEDSSMAGLKKGVPVTRKELIAGLLLCSGNDAARTMAVTAGRILLDDNTAGTFTALYAFMDEVNRQARELGLTGTHFVTPDGYHDYGHYTTSNDLIRIAELALSEPTMAEIMSTVYYPVHFIDGTDMVWHTFVETMVPGNPYYCPYITGMKTGFTTPAGRCLITSAEFEGKTYIIGTLGCYESKYRNTDILHVLEDYVFQPKE